ncbi:YoaK family protein [Siphonobacter sp.]|uniref:YoaK family protein n=1 Tax=Siphonobacter sp. TaxID=1869184 RepID=UPI003B3AF638
MQASLAAQQRLAVIMALLAGFIDAVAFLQCKTYVSFMSGNTTQAGFSITQEKYGIVLTCMTAIVSFTTGVYAGTYALIGEGERTRIRLFRVISGILFFYVFLSHVLTIAQTISVGVIAFAMGLMNTLITAVGKQAVNTDFVTGTLSTIARQMALFTTAKNFADKQQSKKNALRLLLIWLGFIGGAGLAVVCLQTFHSWVLCVPAGALWFLSYTYTRL